LVKFSGAAGDENLFAQVVGVFETATRRPRLPA